MPVKLFSRGVLPSDLKILFASTEQTTTLPTSLAFSENENPRKQKKFCDKIEIFWVTLRLRILNDKPQIFCHIHILIIQGNSNVRPMFTAALFEG